MAERYTGQQLWACDPNGQQKKIQLGKWIGRGGESEGVYEIGGNPSLCAKIYKDKVGDKAKIVAMLKNDPLNPHLAWPKCMLLDYESNLKGFIMPCFPNTYEIHKIYSVDGRRDEFKGLFSWYSLFVMAMNYASVVANIHAKGHYVGDINSKNVRVSEDALIKIIDCDSFFIVDGSKIYKNALGTPEYAAPEVLLSNIKYNDRTQETDRFSMAIIIFQLLMLGYHPFSGVSSVSEKCKTTSNIKSGETPHFKKCREIEVLPEAPSVDILPRKLYILFEKTFVDGHKSPKKRVTAIEWFNTLKSLRKNLEQCQTYRTCDNPNHVYFHHLDKCPWCEYIGKHKKDPFSPNRKYIRTTLDKIGLKLNRLEMLKVND
jgi:DNA-binding helix-hairpin-helix protein with protein kinase domain